LDYLLSAIYMLVTKKMLSECFLNSLAMHNNETYIISVSSDPRPLPDIEQEGKIDSGERRRRRI